MNEQAEITIQASDVTGQRSARWSAPTSMVMSAILSQAVSQLRLPVQGAQDQPIVYHGYDEGTGELLPADERVEQVLQRFRVQALLAVRVIPELEAARA